MTERQFLAKYAVQGRYVGAGRVSYALSDSPEARRDLTAAGIAFRHVAGKLLFTIVL